MTWQLIVFIILSHVAVVVLVFGLVYGLPSLARSAYRYRLWNIRDEVWDAVYRGDLREVAEARELLDAVEARIRSVHNWSAVRVLSAAYAMNRHLPGELQRLSEEGPAPGVPEAYSDTRVVEYAERVEDVSVTYIRFATGFGWFRRPSVALMRRFGFDGFGSPDRRAGDDVEAAGDSIDREFRALVSRIQRDSEARDIPLSGRA